MTRMLHKMTKEKKLKSAIVAGVTFLCGAGAVFYMVSGSEDKSFLSLHNFPDAVAVETFVQTKDGTSSVATTGSIINLPQNLESAISTPYRISTAVRMLDESYRDFVITVASGEIDVTADGFNPQDTVSLTLNGADPSWTPADWSGKIELTAAFTAKKNMRACIDVDNGTEKLSLCHNIKEGWIS